jgi:lipopolysaccharide export system protein LptA
MGLKLLLASPVKSAGLAAFIILMAAQASFAAGAKPAVKNESLNSRETPVVVTARSLFADNKTKIVTYKDDVVVKKGDITLYAEEVVIHLKKDDNAPAKPKSGADVFQGSGKIDTIVAKGNVKIVQQDKTATSDEATYYSGADKFVLTGKPRVWQGDNVLTGTTITYDIQNDTFQADQAKTVLYQQGETPVKAAGTQTKSAGAAGGAEKKPDLAPKVVKPGLPKGSKGINIK